VAVVEAAWCLSGNYLALHSLSTGTVDRFRKRFFRTFNLKLVPWSPLDWLEDDQAVEAILNATPIGGA
jgi:hypothetical protein